MFQIRAGTEDNSKIFFLFNSVNIVSFVRFLLPEDLPSEFSVSLLIYATQLANVANFGKGKRAPS